MTRLTWLTALALLIGLRMPAQGVRPVDSLEITGRAATGATLPDSPGFLASGALPQRSRIGATPVPTPPCTPAATEAEFLTAQQLPPCPPRNNPYRPFVDASKPYVALTSRQKGYLAFHDVIDPFNLLTVVANSAFTIGIDSHTAFGPGMHGFGLNIGTSLLQDVTGEAIGTFGVCSLFHQDPRYFRMPKARPWRRVAHVLSHVVVAQGDDGKPMLNYENLIVYPASAEIANLYVPGVAGNGPSTVRRILTGLATEPIGNIIAEFLPDVARRIHVNIVVVQQILNQISAGQPL